MSEPTTLLKPLRFDLIPEDPSLLPVRLVCGPQFVIGRNKLECDLVTWFIPRTEENDRETRKLSQIHAFLQHEGTRLRFRDADCAAGTFWNEQHVPPGEGITLPVGSAGKLILGRHYAINLHWFPIASPACAVVSPVASEPAFRRCLWMTAARCAFQRVAAPPTAPWLMPCDEGDAADLVLIVRNGVVWWQPRDGAENKMHDGAQLTLADVTFTGHSAM